MKFLSIIFLLTFSFLGQVFFLKKRLLAGSFFYFLSFFFLFPLLKGLTFQERNQEREPARGRNVNVKNLPRGKKFTPLASRLVKFLPRVQKFTKGLEKETWVVIVVFLLSIILRGVNLKNIPYLVDGDSSRFAIEGERAFHDKLPLFETSWQGHTNFYLFFVGLFKHFW